MFFKQVLYATLFCIPILKVFGQGVLGGEYKFNQDINERSEITERKRGVGYLYVLPNKRYFLEIDLRISEDIFSGVTISTGSYVDSNNYFVLRDELNKYSLIFKKNADSGYFINGFYGLIGKKFYFENVPFSADSLVPIETLTEDIQNKAISDRKSYKLNYPIPIRLCPGLYDSFHFNLRVFRNKRYSLNFGGLIISKGFWSRDGNELVLYDNYLKRKFYMLIGKHILISKLLPGDAAGLSFYLRKKY